LVWLILALDSNNHNLLEFPNLAIIHQYQNTCPVL
jgi:hypothetical protein